MYNLQMPRRDYRYDNVAEIKRLVGKGGWVTLRIDIGRGRRPRAIFPKKLLY